MRAIGIQKGAIMQLFIFESLILGIIGALIGGIMSLLFGYIQIFLVAEDSLRFFFDPSTLIQVPFAMSIGILVSLLSGFYPAWKASRLNPIEALKYE